MRVEDCESWRLWGLEIVRDDEKGRRRWVIDRSKNARNRCPRFFSPLYYLRREGTAKSNLESTHLFSIAWDGYKSD